MPPENSVEELISVVRTEEDSAEKLFWMPPDFVKLEMVATEGGATCIAESSNGVLFS